MGRTDFSDQFRKIIIRDKHIGYDLNVMRQSACLVINTITVENFAALLKMHAGGSGARLYDGPDTKLFILFGWAHQGPPDDLRLVPISSCVV